MLMLGTVVVARATFRNGLTRAHLTISRVLRCLAASAVIMGAVSVGGEMLASAQSVGSPPVGKARIVVFRPDSLGGAIGRGWPVKLDDQAVGDVKAGSFAAIDRPPGRHQLSLDMFDFPGVSRHGFSAAAGHVYIFRVKLKDKAQGALQAGSIGGVLGYAIAAGVYGANDKSGAFEFVPLGEAAGKQATSGLRQASAGN